MKNLFKTFLITVLLAILIIFVCWLALVLFPITLVILVFGVLWFIVYDFYISVEGVKNNDK